MSIDDIYKVNIYLVAFIFIFIFEHFRTIQTPRLSRQVVILRVELCLFLKFIYSLYRQAHICHFQDACLLLPPPPVPLMSLFLLEELSFPSVGAPICRGPRLLIRGRFLFREPNSWMSRVFPSPVKPVTCCLPAAVVSSEHPSRSSPAAFKIFVSGS